MQRDNVQTCNANGTPGRIRTCTGQCLRLLPLPLGYRGATGTGAWIRTRTATFKVLRPTVSRLPCWSRWEDLNLQPCVDETPALPVAPQRVLVLSEGFEPPTLRLRVACAAGCATTGRLVREARFELAPHCLEGRYSGRLSYSRTGAAGGI